jgi:hypothetical protein
MRTALALTGLADFLNRLHGIELLASPERPSLSAEVATRPAAVRPAPLGRPPGKTPADGKPSPDGVFDLESRMNDPKLNKQRRRDASRRHGEPHTVSIALAVSSEAVHHRAALQTALK